MTSAYVGPYAHPAPLSPIQSSFRSSPRGCEGGWCFMTSILLKLGRASPLQAAVHGSITWSCGRLEAVHLSCLRRVPRPWRRYDSTRWVSDSAWAYLRTGADDEQDYVPSQCLSLIYRYRGSKSPVSGSWGLGNHFQPNLLYRRHGDILDNHVPCVLRAYCPHEGQYGDLFAL